jgi:rubredoxin
MTKKATGKQDLITLLETSQNTHARNSISRWQSAVRSFESLQNPSRVMLYDMYDDLMMDGHLAAVWGKRQDNIRNKRLFFTRNQERDDEITALINTPDMRAMMIALLDAQLYGYTLIQVNDIRQDADQEAFHIDFDLIPRKHVHPEPGFECISRNQSSADRNFLFMVPPLSNYMIHAGDPHDRGLLAAAAPYIIYKRDTLADWSEFSEMFGHPFREAIYEGTDDSSRRRMEEFLEQWGSRAYLLHPRNIEIILHDSGKNSASSEIYDRLIAVCDAGVSKTILGNTLTTEQGDKGARSLGEVHQAEEDDKKLSDENFILGILNSQFIAILKRFGFNVAAGEIGFETPDADWQELKLKWEVVAAISDRIPVDPDYIYSTFDIPKPDNFEQRMEEINAARQIPAALSVFADDPDAQVCPVCSATKKSLFERLTGFFAQGR